MVGAGGASHYLVQRAVSPDGPFATLSTVTDPRTYTDAPAQGTWYYRIDAVTGAGELWLHLPLNGDANDASGHGLRAQLKGGTGWGEGRAGGSAVQLDGRSGHVALPDGAVSALGDFTIAVWVHSSESSSARVRAARPRSARMAASSRAFQRNTSREAALR